MISKTQELANLVSDSRTFMSQIAKAKTARLSKSTTYIEIKLTSSPNFDWLLPTFREGVADEGYEWEYWMGKIGEESVLEAISRD